MSAHLVNTLVVARSSSGKLILPPRLTPVRMIVIPVCGGSRVLGGVSTGMRNVIGGLGTVNVSIGCSGTSGGHPKFGFTSCRLGNIPIHLMVNNHSLRGGAVRIVHHSALRGRAHSYSKVRRCMRRLLRSVRGGVCRGTLGCHGRRVIGISSCSSFGRRVRGNNFVLTR